MDIHACVARRTRSRTESYLNSILNKSKAKSAEAHSDTPLDSRTEKLKKRASSMRNASSSPPPEKAKRLRTKDEDDDVEFVRTVHLQGKPEKGSPSAISESSDDVMVCDFSVNNANSKAEEEEDKTYIVTPVSPDDDVVFLGTIPRDKDDHNVDRACDLSVDDDADSQDEDKTSPLIPSVPEVSAVSLSSDEEGSISSDSSYGESGESDEDLDTDSSDHVVESSDSSYMESSESDSDSSGDDEGCTRDAAKGKKSLTEKVLTREKLKTFARKNDIDVFSVLARSIWERTKLFEEDICSGDEAAGDDSIEDVIVRKSSTEKVYEQREPRSYHRVRKKNDPNVTDMRGNSYCEKGESFDGGERPWDTPPLNLRFGCEEPVPIEKTEEENEIDRLWEDMAFALTLEGVNSFTPTKNVDVPCCNGKHCFVLDEEIGYKCRYCFHVEIEAKYISPSMEKYQANVHDKKTGSERKGNFFLNKMDFGDSDHSSYVASLKDIEGTVWEYIPDIKETLYPHQREGFEFIWKNIAGSTKLDELKSSEVKESGGCIISHSPGTGKTRLTIVFLKSYLERFPDSHPVVIAPASLLLTWEEEFRKWNSDIPFYNMNSLEFSGHENKQAVLLLKGNKNHRSNKHSVRMVKLYSWRYKKSILGVSYPLYEKLVGNKFRGEMQEFRKMLLELPGLLVLDEGHTPRNQNSCIWKVLSEVKTKKRIILSGTPFQNNFKELSNVLRLARPAYEDAISSRLHDLSKRNQEGKTGRFDQDPGIVELRDMIAPFVHVHKGNILRESLPGIKECVVVLNPPFLQKKILARIDTSQNTFELEHKLSAISVHPSLYLSCNPTKMESLLIGPKILETLESIKLDSKEGVKTRFLIDFIRFSETVKEKVLVFSQYIDTLKLIMEQLSAVFRWTEGEEILFMHGQLEQRDRQHLINNFNKPDSESKVMLASTKACSEGINLVGASRVVLLDVVWNPSVERQAISRAYRIGQKKVVYTYHLIVKNTSEWDKYCTQTNKHRISEMVFSSTNEKDNLINSKVVSEDRILDEMVRHEKLKDMFDKILYRPKESDAFTKIL